MSGNAALIHSADIAAARDDARYLRSFHDEAKWWPVADRLQSLADYAEALEAKLQQQADRIAWLEGDVAGWRIKNQQLREALEALVDATAYLYPNPNSPHAEKWEGWREAALDKAASALDGTPSAAQTLEDATPTERAEASSNG